METNESGTTTQNGGENGAETVNTTNAAPVKTAEQIAAEEKTARELAVKEEVETAINTGDASLLGKLGAKGIYELDETEEQVGGLAFAARGGRFNGNVTIAKQKSGDFDITYTTGSGKTAKVAFEQKGVKAVDLASALTWASLPAVKLEKGATYRLRNGGSFVFQKNMSNFNIVGLVNGAEGSVTVWEIEEKTADAPAPAAKPAATAVTTDGDATATTNEAAATSEAVTSDATANA